jgi:hypothetical protein
VAAGARRDDVETWASSAALAQRAQRRGLRRGGDDFGAQRGSGAQDAVIRDAVLARPGQQRGQPGEQLEGLEELYDLSADPGEQRDLAVERALDLPAWRARLAQATGWPVGPGLRVHLKGKAGKPFELVFPVPVAEAGLLDPEADRTRRANVEWGEVPRTTREQVAKVALSEDRLRVRVEPGAKPTGTIYVLFADPAPQALSIESGGLSRALGLDAGEQTFDGARLSFEAGTLIVPRDSMAEHMAAGAGDAEDMEALKALGYVE